MKRWMATALLVFGAFWLGTLWRNMKAGAEHCAPLLSPSPGVVIQDINGNAEYDPLGEAIALLQWQFLGGPAPVPPCPTGLPDTGQTKCYDTSGTVIPCSSATCLGQDGYYATGCPSEGRYIDNGDSTVSDKCTRLMWQKDTADVNGNGKADGGDAVGWCDPLAYCEQLSLAGYDDWRLPNIRELLSIVDYARFAPAMDPNFGSFPDGAVGGWYWASTTHADYPGSPWSVDFNDGSAGRVGIRCDGGSSRYVRAVRTY